MIFYSAITKMLLILEDVDEHFTTISLDELVNDSATEIELPVELARKFHSQGRIKSVSYIYNNVEALFPNSLPGEENDK